MKSQQIEFLLQAKNNATDYQPVRVLLQSLYYQINFYNSVAANCTTNSAKQKISEKNLSGVLTFTHRFETDWFSATLGIVRNPDLDLAAISVVNEEKKHHGTGNSKVV